MRYPKDALGYGRGNGQRDVRQCGRPRPLLGLGLGLGLNLNLTLSLRKCRGPPGVRGRSPRHPRVRITLLSEVKIPKRRP